MNALSTIVRATRAATCSSLSACALALLGIPAAADDPAPGYAVLTGLAYPGQSQARTLANGDIVTFDGASIDRWSAAGAHLVHLGAFDPPRYTGVFELSPDESHVLLGETGDVTDPLFMPSGDMYRIPLDGTGPAVLSPGTSAFLTVLVFNYDAVFESPSSAIVSAAQGGFGAGNDLVRLDTSSGAAVLVAHVAGPSGPVCFDPAGNLWYATQSDAFPPPPGATDLILWPAALLTGASVLGATDAIAFATGFDGGADLAWEASTGAPLLAENLFSTGTSRLYQAGNSPANSTVLVEGAPFGWISGLEPESGAGPATLHPYQPAGGALVRYLNSGARNELHPARPTAGFAGPGASPPGLGALTFEVQGGPPGGDLVVLIAPAPLGPELAYSLPSVAGPLFSGLNAAAFAVVPGSFPLDARGTGGVTVEHQGTLFGLLAAQALVLDPLGQAVGTSTGAEL